MERADWLDERVNPADARFLMVTAITHHRFSSPIWGAREVRKLQAELAEITKRAAEILHEHQAAAKPDKEPRPAPKFRGVFGAPASLGPRSRRIMRPRRYTSTTTGMIMGRRR
jgi:hypothetical protein